jgi:DNA-binding MarR family transcriptional regulator
MITPHAMRIAALMVQEPRTLGDIASILKIKPQYVFVFISAAHALGLVGQARREADVLVVAPEIKPSQKQSLLSRIISKLRGSNA